MIRAHFSIDAPVFHGRVPPEKGLIVGYAAIIHRLELKMPLPLQCALIGKRNKKYQTEEWIVLPKSYLPEDHGLLPEIEALYKHLVFALKYEGVNLLFFKLLSFSYTPEQLTTLVNIEPTGQYSRRIWFLIEWVTGTNLPGKAALSKSKKSYIPLLDDKIQYAIEGNKSARHLVINNLPGVREFCPLIRKTEKLAMYSRSNLKRKKDALMEGMRKGLFLRASGFLLLKDSKASFTIEGESPKSKRAARWGEIIGQAGAKDLNMEELLRLQQSVIESGRFVEMGFRKKSGFVGEHDRDSGEPLPDHISARHEDVESLLEGVLQTYELLLKNDIDAVIAAAVVAFGFVFIHPFEDGNGRIHRYLIHHMLARKNFSQYGIIFPVSASMLSHINDYRNTLESYSRPLLDFIEWKETKDHNIEVLNNTIDYYRYFDATKQAEFLYDCVKDTVENFIPQEVSYLIRYDEFKRYLEEDFEMPDKMIALLTRFLDQNNGVFSERAKNNEFSKLTKDEIKLIEERYRNIFK